MHLLLCVWELQRSHPWSTVTHHVWGSTCSQKGHAGAARELGATLKIILQIM